MPLREQRKGDKSVPALSIALDLIERGIVPVPVPIGKKGPVIQEWQGPQRHQGERQSVLQWPLHSTSAALMGSQAAAGWLTPIWIASRP